MLNIMYVQHTNNNTYTASRQSFKRQTHIRVPQQHHLRLKNKLKKKSKNRKSKIATVEGAAAQMHNAFRRIMMTSKYKSMI